MLTCDTLLLTKGVGVGLEVKERGLKKERKIPEPWFWREREINPINRRERLHFTISLIETVQFLSFAKKKRWHVSLRELFAQVWEIWLDRWTPLKGMTLQFHRFHSRTEQSLFYSASSQTSQNRACSQPSAGTTHFSTEVWLVCKFLRGYLNFFKAKNNRDCILLAIYSAAFSSRAEIALAFRANSSFSK